jgi:hypothetical protein
MFVLKGGGIFLFPLLFVFGDVVGFSFLGYFMSKGPILVFFGPFECSRLLHVIGCKEFLFLNLSRVLALSGPYMFVCNSKKTWGLHCYALRVMPAITILKITTWKMHTSFTLSLY